MPARSLRLFGRLRRAALYVVLCCAAASATACTGTGGKQGAQWPDVTISDAAGGSTRSGQVLQAGRPAVLAIWGVNCAPCRQELPRLEQLGTTNTEVDVAAVNSGDSPGAIADYLDDLDLDLRVFIDSEARLTESLGVSALPATVFVRADGRIDEVHFGELSAAELEAGVAALATD